MNEHPKLFYASDWPHKFYNAYIEARTTKQYAQAAAARINHFIKTGK